MREETEDIVNVDDDDDNGVVVTANKPATSDVEDVVVPCGEPTTSDIEERWTTGETFTALLKPPDKSIRIDDRGTVKLTQQPQIIRDIMYETWDAYVLHLLLGNIVADSKTKCKTAAKAGVDAARRLGHPDVETRIRPMLGKFFESFMKLVREFNGTGLVLMSLS